MPKYQVRVQCTYSGEETYEIDADSEAEALEIAKSGDVDHSDDIQCDSANWEEAEISEMDE